MRSSALRTDRTLTLGARTLLARVYSEHLELGLFVKGDLAKQIEQMWLYSIEIGLFLPAT